VTRSGPTHDRAGATVVYTDGACRGNPGPGGWAWAVPGGAWASGYDPDTTNQRMEITAAFRAVEAIEGPVHVVSDSTYVVNCFRDEWWKGWLAKGWRNSRKEPVANRDLWEPFVELVRSRDVTFDWVKGHGGDPMNDLVDRLAVAASLSGHGDSGAVPPTEAQLGEPDRPSRTAASSADSAKRRSADRRIPAGTPYAVVGLRSDELAASPQGAVLRRQLAAVLAAHSTLHPDLVVLTGLRPGAEEVAALAAADAGVPYAVILPYPDPAARWPEVERTAFERACEGAREVVTLEQKRPTDGAGRRSALARRDGWLRSVAAGAVVVTDGTDPEAELLLRRFTEALGDEVWTLELAPAS
jgi:ribonuclease HI